MLRATAQGLFGMIAVLAVLFGLLLASDHLRRPAIVAQAISSGLADGTLAIREPDGTIISHRPWPQGLITHYSECLVFSMLLRQQPAGISESLRSWIHWVAEPPYTMPDYCGFLSEMVLQDRPFLAIPYQRY